MGGGTVGAAVLVLLWTAAPAPSADRNLQRSMLKAHNSVREKLDLSPLQWSDKLGDVAYNWAMTLLLQSAFLICNYNPPGNIIGRRPY